MSSGTGWAAWVLAAVLLALGVGCQRRSTPEGAAPEGTTSERGQTAAVEAPLAPQVVTVVATEYAFARRGPIPAGVTQVRLEDHGQQAHHMQLYRLEDGKTAADLVKELETWPKVLPKWAVAAGGPGGVEPGETVDATMQLEPGSYVYLCYAPDSAGVPHMRRGMLQALEIRPGSQRSGVEPAADLSLLLDEHEFRLSRTPTAGPHVVRVENVGAQTHEAFLFRLGPGRSVDEFLAWTDGGEIGPAPGRWAGGLSGLGPGWHGYFSAALEPGDYVLICYVNDEGDGRPHYQHGMVKKFTVG